MDARSYDFVVDTDVATAVFLNGALTWAHKGLGVLQPGETVTASFTEAQMQDFLQRTQKMIERSEGRHDRLAPLVQGGDGVAFAIGIARRLQGDAVRFSRNLQQVALDGEPRGSIRPIELTRTDWHASQRLYSNLPADSAPPFVRWPQSVPRSTRS